MGYGIHDDETKRMAAPQLLQECAQLCDEMYEAQVMCDQVRRRLMSTANTLERVTDELNPASDQEQLSSVSLQELSDKFADILMRFHDFLTKSVGKVPVLRLVSKRVVVNKIKNFHMEIDFFLAKQKELADEAQNEVHEWENRFENACVNMNIAFAEQSRDRMAMLRELTDLQSQKEALTLVMYEYKRPGGGWTAPEMQVIQNAFNTITRFSRAKAPVVPKWFLPLHDIEYDSEALFELAFFVSVHRGMYLEDTPVIVKFLRMDMTEPQLKEFEKACSLWFALSEFSHVTRLYGANHVGELFYIVESTEKGTLDEFVAERRDCVWEKLYEAAQGLQYLHDQEIIHGDLKTSNIVIDVDGKAKIADNILGALGSSDGVQGEQLRWKPPEIQNEHYQPTFASDIYSFGKCILDAAAPGHASAAFDQLSQKPDNLSENQWALVKKMCAVKPEERPEVAVVVEKLQQFAEAESREKNDKASAKDMLASMKTDVTDEDKEDSALKKEDKKPAQPTAFLTRKEKREARRKEKEEKKRLKKQKSDSKCVVM